MHQPMENLRQSYKPDYIKILFIQETPPKAGDFFYLGNSPFNPFTRRAFEAAYNLKFISLKAFLDYFKNRGCFVDHLTHEPISHFNSGRRNRVPKNNVLSLAMRIQIYQPDIIIACLKKIEPHVQEAVRISDIDCRFYSLPFPGNGNQNEYVDGLIRILKEE